MSKPLVFDEQLATGTVRFELFGDEANCRKFLHAGRTVLGGMRVMYGINERAGSDEGSGFYHRWSKVQIGGERAAIHAISNDGLDVVRIYAGAPPPQPELPPPDSMIGMRNLRIVGYCNNPDVGDVATLWIRNTTTFVGPDNGSQSVARDISDDGDTVVGDGGTFGWYWRKTDGCVLLPPPPDGYGGAAYGVSADGRFICGTAQLYSGGTRNWVYDVLNSSYELLPGNDFANQVRISPNALWVAGGITVWHRQNIHDAWSVYAVLPPPGTKTNVSTSPENVPQTYIDDAYQITDICNDGTACGYNGHYDVQVWEEGGASHGTFWTPTVPNSKPAFRWTPMGGVNDVGVAGPTTQIAGDTKSKDFAGDTSTVEYGTIVIGIFPTGVAYGIGLPLDGTTTDFGFVFGQRGQRMLGADTVAQGISDDGLVIVGATLLHGDTSGGLGDRPVWWDGDTLAPTELPLLDGAQAGRALAVTTKAGRMKLINPGVPPSNEPFDTPPPNDLPAEADPTLK